MEGKEGILTISLKEEDLQESESQGRQAVLSVSDTGCGISQEAMANIFEPFYTTKRSGKGTGLGLSVVQNVMDSVNGRIRIESQVGSGTAFYLSFPLITPASSLPVPPPGSIHRLIVVDDDTALLKSLKAMIKTITDTQMEENADSGSRGKIRADYYDHPAAVLSRLEQHKNCCDILLTDYSMPSVNGLELAQLVRCQNPHIFLVLMSGCDRSQFEPYLKSGVIDCFIAKTDLAEKLPVLLGKGT